MATYPIKMLKDEENKPFVPLVSTDCIRDENNQTLQQILDKKLSSTNLLAGDYVNITTEGNNCYINVDLPANLNIINNLTTESAGQGALDAYQGKVLKDSIPQVINDLSSTSTASALSANQGYILNQKFNDYLPLHGTADKAATVGNLVVRSKSMWGTLTESNGYTVVNAWDSPADGGIALSDKDNRLSVQIDGFFYQEEGRYRVLDTRDQAANYGFYKWPSMISLTDSNPTVSKEITITTKRGNPVLLIVSGDNNPKASDVKNWFRIFFYRNGTKLCQQTCESNQLSQNLPFCMQYLDVVGSGTYTYKVEFVRGNGQCDLGEDGPQQTPNFTVIEL